MSTLRKGLGSNVFWATSQCLRNVKKSLCWSPFQIELQDVRLQLYLKWILSENFGVFFEVSNFKTFVFKRGKTDSSFPFSGNELRKSGDKLVKCTNSNKIKRILKTKVFKYYQKMRHSIQEWSKTYGRQPIKNLKGYCLFKQCLFFHVL